MGSHIVIGFVYKQKEILRADIRKILEFIKFDSIELRYLSDIRTDTWKLLNFYTFVDNSFTTILCDNDLAEAVITKSNRQICFLRFESSEEDEMAIEIAIPEENVFQSDYSASNIINSTDACLQNLLLLNKSLNCEYIFCDAEAQIESTKQRLMDSSVPIYSIEIFNTENDVSVRLGTW